MYSLRIESSANMCVRTTPIYWNMTQRHVWYIQICVRQMIMIREKINKSWPICELRNIEQYFTFHPQSFQIDGGIRKTIDSLMCGGRKWRTIDRSERKRMMRNHNRSDAFKKHMNTNYVKWFQWIRYDRTFEQCKFEEIVTRKSIAPGCLCTLCTCALHFDKSSLA